MHEYACRLSIFSTLKTFVLLELWKLGRLFDFKKILMERKNLFIIFPVLFRLKKQKKYCIANLRFFSHNFSASKFFIRLDGKFSTFIPVTLLIFSTGEKLVSRKSREK